MNLAVVCGALQVGHVGIGGFGQPRAWANVASGAPVVRVIAMDAGSRSMVHIRLTGIHWWFALIMNPRTFQGLVHDRCLLATRSYRDVMPLTIHLSKSFLIS